MIPGIGSMLGAAALGLEPTAAGYSQAASAYVPRLTSHLLIALLPVLILVVALDAYCLIDLAKATSARGAPKVVWALIILFVSAPIGALVYLFFGRKRPGHQAVAMLATMAAPTIATLRLRRREI
jgi:Phospholipase_D-nuclease N-terminal